MKNSSIENILARMTLEEKIGQMTQVEKNSITPEEVEQYAIGSLLSGGGGNPDPNTPENWANMVRSYAEAALRSRPGIPLIYGSDAVHGHNNVKGATIFPHNIGLGATRDPQLVEAIGKATGRECLATGVHWDFAPAVSVAQDIRWGRYYEGYSEDTELVTALGTAFIRGLHSADLDGMWVLPSVKHYVGDGGTTWGTTVQNSGGADDNWQAANERYQIDQGDTRVDEATLRSVHLAPYVEAIKQGALNIMASFSSWNGVKMHSHKYLLTDVLKGEFGFEGFIVSDWKGIDQINASYYACVVQAINAGIDMVMVPFDFKRFISTALEAVENCDIDPERIDDAVRRILHVKSKLGLFEKPLADAGWLSTVGTEEHRRIAREAVQKSLVLLKNDKDTLPFAGDAGKIYVAGEAANDIGLACGGWTIEWLGGRGPITTGRTLLDGIKDKVDGVVEFAHDAAFTGEADFGIVVIAEDPYAEGQGDRADLVITDEQRQLVMQMRAKCKKLVLIIYSGRPLIITEIVDSCDAIVAAWLPGSEAHAIADVLIGDVPFSGKLSVSWPRTMSQVPLAELKQSTEAPLWNFNHGLDTGN